MTMQATRIHLLRHGQVLGYQQKRYNGQTDVPLTELGRKQSLALAQRFADQSLGGIYASDLSRCRITAEQIARGRQVSVELRAELRELHAGSWEGRAWRELEREDPELWRVRLADIVHVAPPGGETVLQLARRVRRVICEITAAHQGEEIVVVGHGGVNRVVLLDAIGAPLEALFRLEQDYGCHNVIDYFPDGSVRVKQVNA